MRVALQTRDIYSNTMPPKRTPSARSSAKKAAPAPAPAASPPEEAEDAKPNVDQASSDVELPSDPLANEPAPTPASATPAPSTSTTAPVRRLETLSKSAVGSPASRGRGSSATAPKFGGRRSQAKRDELLKAEENRKRGESEVRATEAAARPRVEPRRQDDRSRGRSRGGGVRLRGTGRGGYVGDPDRHPRQSVASGPFSAGQASSKGKQRVRRSQAPRGSQKGYRPSGVTRTDGDTGRSGGSRTATPPSVDDGSRIKSEVGPSTDTKPFVDGDGDVSMEIQRGLQLQDGGYISSDEDELEKNGGAQRVNVEDLGIIDLTQDDDASQYNPFAPVRVLRVAHRERALGINADGATNQEGTVTVDANDAATATVTTEKKKGKQKAKEVEITGEKQRFQGVYSDSETDEPEPHIKPDPEGLAGTPEPVPRPTSADLLPQEPPSSPESRRKGKERIKARAVLSSDDAVPEPPPDYQTREEVEEWERHLKDLQILRRELGVPAPEVRVDGGGDARMTDPSRQQPKDKRADKVYLFQFPPVLPDLVPITVKPDPDAVDGVESNGAMDIDDNSQKNPINIHDSSNQPSALPSGAVGKLNVHASGRVTLDWGGTSLCLGMGAEASFLQDVVVARVPDEDKDGDGMEVDGEGSRGVAMSMGQVKGKFVVTPDWGSILG